MKPRQFASFEEKQSSSPVLSIGNCFEIREKASRVRKSLQAKKTPVNESSSLLLCLVASVAELDNDCWKDGWMDIIKSLSAVELIFIADNAKSGALDRLSPFLWDSMTKECRSSEEEHKEAEVSG